MLAPARSCESQRFSLESHAAHTTAGHCRHGFAIVGNFANREREKRIHQKNVEKKSKAYQAPIYPA